MLSARPLTSTLARWGQQKLHRMFASPSGSVKSYDTTNPNLRRAKGDRDITQMDLLEERIRTQGQKREFTINGQTQRWNYRSEVVNHLGLDNKHRNVWIAYGIIIIVGFTAFVWVKSNVVLGRKEEMEERERIRKALNLTGSDRRKIAVVDA